MLGVMNDAVAAAGQAGANRRDVPRPRLVLASASRTRRRLLAEAGVACLAASANVDEAAVRTAMRAAGRSPADTALALAEAKALAVWQDHRDALVIGADQILECNGRWFEKPRDLADAEASLKILRDRSHRLLSAVAVAQDGRCHWRHIDVAVMTMRAFSDAFLADYLLTAGAEALDTVAGYRFEGSGVQLFSAFKGDVFTILGLPLLPLFGYLRGCGAMAD